MFLIIVVIAYWFLLARTGPHLLLRGEPETLPDSRKPRAGLRPTHLQNNIDC